MPRAFRPRSFLLAAWGVNVCVNAFYIAPSAVFPQMITDLRITNAQAGSLISFYLVAILLFQLPSGYIVDRVDPRKIIAAACLALLGLSVGMTLVPRYDVLLVLRILAGIPVAFIFAPAAFLVSRAFERTPGRAVGIFLSAPPAG
ncbi:MAG TPA: MFS transporter, partial [Thermoplasmata archaeon]|nr:MFS transporter [Thermoplasmata archaeon]